MLGVIPTYFQGTRRVWTSNECAMCIALFVLVSTSVTFKQTSSLFFHEFPNNLAFQVKQARMSQCGWDSALAPRVAGRPSLHHPAPFLPHKHNPGNSRKVAFPLGLKAAHFSLSPLVLDNMWHFAFFIIIIRGLLPSFFD